MFDEWSEVVESPLVGYTGFFSVVGVFLAQHFDCILRDPHVLLSQKQEK